MIGWFKNINEVELVVKNATLQNAHNETVQKDMFFEFIFFFIEEMDVI